MAKLAIINNSMSEKSLEPSLLQEDFLKKQLTRTSKICKPNLVNIIFIFKFPQKLISISFEITPFPSYLIKFRNFNSLQNPAESHWNPILLINGASCQIS